LGAFALFSGDAARLSVRSGAPGGPSAKALPLPSRNASAFRRLPGAGRTRTSFCACPAGRRSFSQNSKKFLGFQNIFSISLDLSENHAMMIEKCQTFFLSY
jgi:hypothetical protein